MGAIGTSELPGRGGKTRESPRCGGVEIDIISTAGDNPEAALGGHPRRGVVCGSLRAGLLPLVGVPLLRGNEGDSQAHNDMSIAVGGRAGNKPMVKTILTNLHLRGDVCRSSRIIRRTTRAMPAVKMSSARLILAKAASGTGLTHLEEKGSTKNRTRRTIALCVEATKISAKDERSWRTS